MIRKLLNGVRSIIWRSLGVDYRDLRTAVRDTRPGNTFDRQDWIRMGEFSFENGARAERFSDREQLEIGRFCSIADDVYFLCGAGIHTVADVSTFPLVDHLFDAQEQVTIGGERRTAAEWNAQMAYSRGPIRVGNDVWIGMRATIQSGVTIGDGAVIMAGAVITKDVPPYAIVGGVPGRVIRYRFAPDIIERLRKIAWWDWDADTIRARVADFYLPVEEFAAKYDAS